MIATERDITRAWKKHTVSFTEVKSILTILMVNEKMTTILHDSPSKFLKVWARVVLCPSYSASGQPGYPWVTSLLLWSVGIFPTSPILLFACVSLPHTHWYGHPLLLPPTTIPWSQDSGTLAHTRRLLLSTSFIPLLYLVYYNCNFSCALLLVSPAWEFGCVILSDFYQ